MIEGNNKYIILTISRLMFKKLVQILKKKNWVSYKINKNEYLLKTIKYSN